MKKIFIILFTIVPFILSAQQSVYNDIIFIKENCWDRTATGFLKNTDGLKKVLTKYYKIDPASITNPVFKDSIQKNPFFTSFVPSGIGFTTFSTAKDFNESQSLPSTGLSLTSAIDGLARFLVERTKQELSIAFFDRFKNDIAQSPDLKILFPQTSRTLMVIGKEIYQFNSYLNTLRQVFAQDMANLYINVKTLSRTQKYQDILNLHPELKTFITNAFYFTDAFAAGKHPGDIVADYDINSIDLGAASKVLTHNLQSGIQMMQVLSASIRSLSPDHYWVPADSLSMFFSDRIKRELYFGIIYQQCRNISFEYKDGSSFRTVTALLDSLKRTTASYETDIRKYQAFIQSLADQISDLNGYLSELKEKKKPNIDFTDYYKLYQTVSLFFKNGFGITRLPGLDGLLNWEMQDKIDNKVDKLIVVLDKTSGLLVDIRTKQYASAVIDAVGLFDEFNLSPGTHVISDTLLKYGTFIANVASAQNAQDVQAAINSIALPVGSSRIKRLSLFNISLNAYTGIAFGKEIIEGVFNNKLINTSAVTAPIGIAFSWGDLRAPFTCHRTKTTVDPKFRGHSFSVFVSLIDIGAVTAFRFGDTSQTTSKLPDIKLQNILAPGVFLSWGVKKSPISFTGGYQYGPLLRSVGTTNTVANNYYQRFILSANVDIPLLNLHTKTR